MAAKKRKPTVLKASRAPARPGPPVPEAFIGHDSATMMSEETFEEFEARMKRDEASKEEREDTSTNTSPALDPDEHTREAPVDPHELPPDEEPADEAWDADDEDPPTSHDDDEDFLPPEA